MNWNILWLKLWKAEPPQIKFIQSVYNVLPNLTNLSSCSLAETTHMPAVPGKRMTEMHLKLLPNKPEKGQHKIPTI